MGKKSVLSTLRFIFLTMGCLVLIFCAVAITVLNEYKPIVKTYINGEFIGYFSSPQQFDEVYNDLVIEIGPGLGNLTEYLLEKAAYVILVEIDNNMINILNDRFKNNNNYQK